MSPGIREDRNMIKRRINICYQNLIVLFVANFVILIFVFVFCIYILRERPFNLKVLIPNVAEKNILILVQEKKNNLIQSFCHIT